jgi:hypothetical protein
MTAISEHVLLISGSGRNVGKTSFMREVIVKNADKKLIAIKITPHFHEPTAGLKSIANTENYRIFQETDSCSDKDSSLFLQAGAEQVYYIQTTDSYLKEAFDLLCSQLNPDHPIITESAALRKYIIPGLYLFIQKPNGEMKPSAEEMMKLAGKVIFSDGNTFSLSPNTIIFKQIWKIHDYD